MTEESTARRRQRLITEFLVIVAGVFIALAAESWWSEREQRTLERELREDMAAEFAGNIAILERDLADNQLSMEHFNRLPDMGEEALFKLTDAYLNTEYRPFHQWAGFDPEMGIVQALVSSGNLSSISDQELRLRLSRWAGLLTEKSRKNLQATTFQMNSMMPIIAEVSADRVWTQAERRRVQSLYQTMTVLHQTVLENQYLLLAEAQDLSAYLAGGR